MSVSGLITGHPASEAALFSHFFPLVFLIQLLFSLHTHMHPRHHPSSHPSWVSNFLLSFPGASFQPSSPKECFPTLGDVLCSLAQESNPPA